MAGIPVYKRADFLGKLMEDKTGIAVAGTHGKTTTTAMLAFVLSEMGRDPSFIVGGVLKNYGVNARAGKGDLFVIEADEYDRMFLGLQPRIEVVTNVEHDHPDCYPTLEDMVGAFESFVSLLPQDGTLIASIEDPGSASLLHQARHLGRRVVAYGLEAERTINAPQWMQARNFAANDRGGFDFEAIANFGEVSSAKVSLQVPGQHNVRNALATLAVIATLGLSLKDAGASLRRFTGTGRRFDVKGERNGVLVVDDYAHHPTEIQATLAAARAALSNAPHLGRLAAAYLFTHEDPFAGFHRRLRRCRRSHRDRGLCSREAKQDFSAAEIVSAMSRPTAHFIASLDDVTAYLHKHVRKDDVVLVLSAGDADQVSGKLLTLLEG